MGRRASCWTTWYYELLLANRSRSRGTPSLADEGDEASAEQGQAEGAEADGQGDDAGRGGLGADGASGGANGLNDGLAVRAEDLVAGPSGRAVDVSALGVTLGRNDDVVAGLAVGDREGRRDVAGLVGLDLGQGGAVNAVPVQDHREGRSNVLAVHVEGRAGEGDGVARLAGRAGQVQGGQVGAGKRSRTSDDRSGGSGAKDDSYLLAEVHFSEPTFALRPEHIRAGGLLCKCSLAPGRQTCNKFFWM